MFSEYRPFIKEEDYQKEQKNNISIIENINNYYFLLSSLLNNCKFNFSKFLDIVKSKTTSKAGGAGAKNISNSFLIDYLKKKKKNKNKKSLVSTNKKKDDMDKKVKYILSYEAILYPNLNINTKQYEDLKEKLRKTWWKEIFDSVLKKSLEKLDKDDIYKFVPKLPELCGSDMDLSRFSHE